MPQLSTANPALVGNKRWFLVHTLPKRERKAEFHLRAQGFRVYLPQIQKTIRHARQLKTIQSPVFPRYLFVALDLTRDRWLSVRSTIGVSYVFTQNGQPCPVPAGVVEALIGRSVDNIVRLDSSLVAGRLVRILSGPFTDFVGTLKNLDGSGRTRILLDVMGASVPVALNRAVLAPAA